MIDAFVCMPVVRWRPKRGSRLFGPYCGQGRRAYAPPPAAPAEAAPLSQARCGPPFDFARRSVSLTRLYQPDSIAAVASTGANTPQLQPRETRLRLRKLPFEVFSCAATKKFIIAHASRETLAEVRAGQRYRTKCTKRIANVFTLNYVNPPSKTSSASFNRNDTTAPVPPDDT